MRAAERPQSNVVREQRCSRKASGSVGRSCHDPLSFDRVAIVQAGTLQPAEASRRMVLVPRWLRVLWTVDDPGRIDHPLRAGHGTRRADAARGGHGVGPHGPVLPEHAVRLSMVRSRPQTRPSDTRPRARTRAGRGAGAPVLRSTECRTKRGQRPGLPLQSSRHTASDHCRATRASTPGLPQRAVRVLRRQDGLGDGRPRCRRVAGYAHEERAGLLRAKAG